MKKIISILVMLAAMFCLIAAANAADSKPLFTCGMHPAIVQDHPGNCPICGMKLTAIKSGAGADAAASSSAIAVDAATQQNMNLRTAEILRGPLRKTIRMPGTIDYNETAMADVTTKFKGWIEKLNVDATGRLVQRGEPMFEIYSPELFSAQTEFLLALNAVSTNDPGSAAVREAALGKLKFFDVTDAQVAELEKSRKARKALPVAAPVSGFVIEKNVVSGQMVEEGAKLYRLADLGTVWVLAQVYEQDLPFVKPGQEALVRITSLPDREFRGRVTFIYPSVDEKTRTAKIRLELENPGYLLKPGMFGSAQIRAELEDSVVLVPDSAVLRSGAKNTVFVALDGGKFEARDVVLGMESENAFVQVISGLMAGECVVTSGQFLLDSESQLREAIEKMRGSTKQGEPQTNSYSLPDNGSREGSPHTTSPKGVLPPLFTCPMASDVDIVSDKPDICPKCEMKLVPTSTLKHGKLAEENWLKKHPQAASPATSHFTCPMHSKIIADKPGICPECKMNLVPAKK